jgi:hypothetical protein
MNGRIYDPLLGRFLSADVMVPHPDNLQSYNRYSYVQNNPLILTDPSGFTDETADQKKKDEDRRRQEQNREGYQKFSQPPPTPWNPNWERDLKKNLSPNVITAASSSTQSD